MAFSSGDIVDPLAEQTNALDENLAIPILEMNAIDALEPDVISSSDTKLYLPITTSLLENAPSGFENEPLQSPTLNTSSLPKVTSTVIDPLGAPPTYAAAFAQGSHVTFEHDSSSSYNPVVCAPLSSSYISSNPLAPSSSSSSLSAPSVPVTSPPPAPSLSTPSLSTPPPVVSSSSSAAAPSSSSFVYDVRVKEAQKVEGTNRLGLRDTFASYVVQTDSSHPGFIAKALQVKRRFSDFESLRKVLRWQFRGLIIPPLPEKSFLESKFGNDEFLKSRQADLQTFLKGVITHPDLKLSEPVRLFLIQPGEMQYNPAWIQLLQQAHLAKQYGLHGSGSSGSGLSNAAAAAAAGVGAPDGSLGASSGKSLIGLGGLVVSWMKQTMVAPAKREMDEEEVSLRKSKGLFKELEKLMQQLAESARHLTTSLDSLGGDLSDLSKQMGLLGKWEEAVQQQNGTYTDIGHSAAKTSMDCRRMAAAAAKQQQVWVNASMKAAAAMVTLHDYYVIVPEAVAALEEREAIWAEIGNLEHEKTVKVAAISQISPSDKRHASMSASVAKLEEELLAAKRLYAEVKQRNQKELLRIQISQESDFRKMMANFAAGQAQVIQASAELWRDVAEHYVVGDEDV
mmetsp:Transcript_7588/g.14903  ORF Transcript_7588/g.14903 Transcript_7588/m.14903 type:complete len:624 (-) Transcript_7588:607-2478(-)|eukprot:CAMPEP_0175050996 /NCGR_PEP_ID=MMETSP0052_2-20121109/7552_1 /TAXON_ID=51329 ORGANISM="Polytomella parva, Strain SAG 63-3" /NCGR_SAMPLE_ID=MMETSP0052_2 /ASSEMBLY_ACC=CAM_ASM_000194 /LENGTH=623 /DNA_ID=CAMNT_0016315227 /DNA_START=19 /DNA_END=1890 /DNA_ORIENTATION=+